MTRERKRIWVVLLMIAMALVLVPNIGIWTAEAGTYVPRKDEPSKTGYYGELNPLPVNSETGGNCTWYAWGRAYEILGSEPNLSTWGNACKWYQNNIDRGGYPYGPAGSAPALGAIACWSGGDGHVAVVEEIYNDGTMLISHSSWSYGWLGTKIISQDGYYGSGYTFQGFIYVAGTPQPPIPGTLLDKGDTFYAAIVHDGSARINIREKNNSVVIENNSDIYGTRWKFEKNTNGSYRISNTSTGNLIDDSDFGNENGSIVKTLPANGSTAQSWFIYQINGKYVFEPECAPGKVLDIAGEAYNGGRKLHLWTYVDGNTNQLFNLDFGYGPLVDHGETFYATLVIDWDYRNYIREKNYSVVIENNSDTFGIRWKFEKNANGSYRISNTSTGNMIDDSDFGNENGSIIKTLPANGSTAQNWFIYQINDEKVVIEPECSPGIVMDIAGESYDGGRKLHLWTYVIGNNNQLFNLEDVGSDPMIPIKNGWEEIDGKKYFYDDSGEKLTGFQKIDKSYYIFDAEGVMQTGWCTLDGKTYYTTGDGVVQTGAKKIDGKTFYFDKKGVKQDGWIVIKDKKYYFDTENGLLIGSKKIDGNWYYFSSKGVLYTGWLECKGKTYYFNEDGIRAKGLISIDGKKYYFSSKGVMTTGWFEARGKFYYFNTNGTMQTGWKKIGGYYYRFNSKGVMQTGWVKYKEKWYYLQDDGKMLTNGTLTVGPKTYIFDENGVCTNP